MQGWTREEMIERDELIRSLLHHKGFKMFQATLEATAKASYSQMNKAPDAHNLAKHFGVHAAAVDFLGWPARELEVIKQELDRQAVDEELTKKNK